MAGTTPCSWRIERQQQVGRLNGLMLVFAGDLLCLEDRLLGFLCKFVEVHGPNSIDIK